MLISLGFLDHGVNADGTKQQPTRAVSEKRRVTCCIRMKHVRLAPAKEGELVSQAHKSGCREYRREKDLSLADCWQCCKSSTDINPKK